MNMKNSILRVLRKIGLVLLGILSFLLTVILLLPLLLLPKTTAVPIVIQIVLFILGLATLSLPFWLRPGWKAMSYTPTAALFVLTLAVILSQAFAMTPPITGDDGKPLPGSIATLEQVTLNGSKQWITIRGKDATKPVLLFLAGGPGGSDLASARLTQGKLEDHFVVVNWEQPGAGKSFNAVDRSKLKVDDYLVFGHELVLQLRERFHQDKVYVVGESWGSALGIMLVQRYPELFHAFAGTGQMVAFTENDLICYDFAMNLAKEHGDAEKVTKLTKQGPPPYYDNGVALEQATYLLDTFDYMNEDPQINHIRHSTWDDLAAPEYGLYDKVSWFRGVLETLGYVYPQLWEVDFRKQATKLDVPVYFLIGRHDVNAPVKLAEEYMNLLEAPYKEIVWFEKSGHNPWVTEGEDFTRAMVEKVLKENP
jgi:pimeloyl-ACP methyl ester carboxylesterase